MADTDRLASALFDLRGDTDALTLPPASEVRSRGDQRTRRRRAALAGTSALALALVVAGAVLGDGLLQGQRHAVPPAVTTTAPAPSQTPSGTPGTGDTPTAGLTPPPVDTVSGVVDPRLFLPAPDWAGPDLAGGHPTVWQPPFDPEGTPQVDTCDGDTTATGNVAMTQVADATTSTALGRQRVRTYASAAQAGGAVTLLIRALTGCQQRLDKVPGNNLTVTVTPDPAGTAGTAGTGGTAGPLAFRVDVATKDRGPAGTEWVTIATDGAGRVSTLVVNEPPAVTDGWVTIRRLGSAALAHLAATPTR